jgi:hypothetical protein
MEALAIERSHIKIAIDSSAGEALHGGWSAGVVVTWSSHVAGGVALELPQLAYVPERDAVDSRRSWKMA